MNDLDYHWPMKVIQAKKISKSFQENKVLQDVDFSVEKGSFTALLGRNGSGKSTILNILMGDLHLDKGDCMIFGENLKDNPDHLKDKMANVSERINFNYPMSVAKFIPEYAKFFSHFNTETFFKMAKDVKLDLNKNFGSYSRGQKMQIVLMAALSQGAELLLIDEVTSVLDAFSRNYFISRLKEFTQKGGTIVLTTNIVTEVQHYCSEVIFLSNSSVKFQSPVESISSNFKKLRSTRPDHEILKHKECFLSGSNSDGTFSYILPLNKITNENHPDLLVDNRAVTLEDLYIYHSQKETNE